MQMQLIISDVDHNLVFTGQAESTNVKDTFKKVDFYN
jgi:hypothetical protein